MLFRSSSDWMDTIGLLERLKYLNRSANPATPGDARFTWSPLDFQARWQLDTPEKAIDFFTLLLLDGDVLENHRALALDTYVKAPANKIPATLGFLLSLPQFEKQ